MDIDKIISVFHTLKEDGGGAAAGGMTTGSTAGAPGFSGSADPKGPVAGFDPVMGFSRRKPPQYAKGGIGSRKLWLDVLKHKKKHKKRHKKRPNK
jgi:hypothetical protein